MEMIRINKSFLLFLAQAGFELAMDGVKDNFSGLIVQIVVGQSWKFHASNLEYIVPLTWDTSLV